MLAATAERQTAAARDYYEHKQWRTERLSRDPRAGALYELILDIEHDGAVRAATWQTFKNEKYSRAAERLKETHHERPDYYPFDAETGDIVIAGADGVRPRYTLRDIYQNGLQKSREQAEADPRFLFQLRRDELFMDFYEEIETMMRGDTDYDTIEMISTLPVEQRGTSAFREKHYDDEHGKQFKYTVRRTISDDGSTWLEMRTTTWYSPKSDVQGTDASVYGKQAAAAVLTSKGFTGVPFALLPTDEFGAYRATSATAGRELAEVDRADTAVYDATLLALTDQEYSYGRRDKTIEAYTLFDHCEPEWKAYSAYYEHLARHLAGGPMTKELQMYMTQLIIGYTQAHKRNDVISDAQFERLTAQIEYGRVSPDMALACNEIIDYAHSARLADILARYAHTGELPQYTGDQSLETYGDMSASSSAAAVENGVSFDDCEDGNSVSGLTAAMQLALSESLSIDEALRRLQKRTSGEMPTIWAAGECVTCLKDTAIAINKCNMCKVCEDAHTARGDMALDQIIKNARDKRSVKSHNTQERTRRREARAAKLKRTVGTFSLFAAS